MKIPGLGIRSSLIEARGYKTFFAGTGSAVHGLAHSTNGATIQINKSEINLGVAESHNNVEIPSHARAELPLSIKYLPHV